MKSTQLFLPVVLLLCLSTPSVAQQKKADPCLDPAYHEQCFFAVKSIFDDYQYLKSRPFSREMDSIKFAINFKKNTLYIMDICQGTGSEAVINLYNQQDELVATTYDPVHKRYNRALSFYSGVSGEYSMSVSLARSQEDCVVVLFGMIRKNVETYVRLSSEQAH